MDKWLDAYYRDMARRFTEAEERRLDDLLINCDPTRRLKPTPEQIAESELNLKLIREGRLIYLPYSASGMRSPQ